MEIERVACGKRVIRNLSPFGVNLKRWGTTAVVRLIHNQRKPLPSCPLHLRQLTFRISYRRRFGWIVPILLQKWSPPQVEFDYKRCLAAYSIGSSGLDGETARCSNPSWRLPRGHGGCCAASLASLRRFWAIAASVNSSCAPRGPRSRRRPSFRMRFKWANNISTRLRSWRNCSNAAVLASTIGRPGILEKPRSARGARSIARSARLLNPVVTALEPTMPQAFPRVGAPPPQVRREGEGRLHRQTKRSRIHRTWEENGHSDRKAGVGLRQIRSIRQ
jgi:hypothetical protein